MRLTGGRGVDVIIDGVGGKLTGEALSCLLPRGTYAVVGYAGGREASVNLTDIIWKAAKVRGFTFRAFAPETLAAAQKTLIGYLLMVAERKSKSSTDLLLPSDLRQSRRRFLQRFTANRYVEFMHRFAVVSYEGTCPNSRCFFDWAFPRRTKVFSSRRGFVR
jgi:NADPH:quinone reductase-like Zn-dependent oxidoreductase